METTTKTIKITTHNVGIHFGTYAVLRVGRRKFVSETYCYGGDTAAMRSVLAAARGHLTTTQFAEAERAYGL